LYLSRFSSLRSMLRLDPGNQLSAFATSQKSHANMAHDAPLTQFDGNLISSQFHIITMPTHSTVSSNLPFPVVGPGRAEHVGVMRVALFLDRFIPDTFQLNVGRGSVCNRLFAIKVTHTPCSCFVWIPPHMTCQVWLLWAICIVLSLLLASSSWISTVWLLHLPSKGPVEKSWANLIGVCALWASAQFMGVCLLPWMRVRKFHGGFKRWRFMN
jgi:hypothetical protein